MSPAYVVTMKPLHGHSHGEQWRDAEDMRSLSDWRAAISAPLTYRIGASTLHFRSHLLLLLLLVVVAVTVLFFSLFTGRSSPGLQRSLLRSMNTTYPLSPPVRSGDSTIWRVAVVEDPDTESWREEDRVWSSRLRYGSLTVWDPPLLRASVSWDPEDVLLSSSLGSGGRGMELSELIAFGGKLVTVDDRTGVVYRLEGAKVVPWAILSDGDGSQTKGLKAEWATVKDGDLWVGGLGKEWTTPQGKLASHDPMWVKVVGGAGEVRHVNWTRQYMAVREAVGVVWPGYMIHEAVCWSPRRRRWVFLPRRVGKERYNDVTDERMGTNLLISADEDFSDISVSRLGPLEPTHGFSSFKFLPNLKDDIIVALKSEEVNGSKATYLTVASVEGRVLLDETRIGDGKFEGIEFV